MKWTDVGGSNLQCHLVSWSGYYKLVNRNSGKVLDVIAASKADGAAVIQWTDLGGAKLQCTMPAALTPS
jgi:hypothetical protein